jgi:hypothetical protein
MLSPPLSPPNLTSGVVKLLGRRRGAFIFFAFALRGLSTFAIESESFHSLAQGPPTDKVRNILDLGFDMTRAAQERPPRRSQEEIALAGCTTAGIC